MLLSRAEAVAITMPSNSKPPAAPPTRPSQPGVAPTAPTTSKGKRFATGSFGSLEDPAELHVVYSVDSELLGRAIRLEREPLFVGRGLEGAGISTTDSQVSRLHARIRWDADAQAHRVDDTGSSNGTFVNGSRVKSSLLLKGAVIRIGDSVFLYDSASPMLALRERVRRGAKSELTVLLLGESGVGKEVLAREVHEASGRTGPFVAVNCGAFQPDLMAAELFGHTKGAFSGAASARAGLFSRAAGGTLFLDEIGDLPLELQPVLLRAINDGRVRAVGADKETHVDARLICATNVDLAAAIEAGTFRQDVFARIAELVFHVPPIRERRTEILPLLLEIGELSQEQVSADAAEALLLWHWPTNVRGIRAIARAFCALAVPGEALGSEFVAAQLPEALRLIDEQKSAPTPRGSEPAWNAPIPAALSRHAGSVAAAAKELGISRSRIYRWLRKMGVTVDRFR